MAIVKVKQGDRIPFVVTNLVRDVPASNPRYGPSHKFVGRTPTDNDAAVFMSPASAERQLARHGLTLDTVVGKAIVFARPGDYVDIEPYTPDAAQPALAPALAPVPAAPAPASNAKQAFSAGPSIAGLDTPPLAPHANTAKLDSVLALHDVCLDHAISVTVRKLTTAGIPFTASDVLSAAATMLIGAQKVGV